MIRSKHYLWDLLQGELEISCILSFSGEQREVLIVQRLAEKISAYITISSDDTDEVPKIKRKSIA